MGRLAQPRRHRDRRSRTVEVLHQRPQPVRLHRNGVRTMTSMIELRNVTKVFTVRATKDQPLERTLTALHDISMDIAAGEFLTLVGLSGSGKTTLLDLLAGLAGPSSGQVRIDGTPVVGPGLDR